LKLFRGRFARLSACRLWTRQCATQ